MRNSTKRLMMTPLVLLAGLFLFSLSSSKPPVEKPECVEKACCQKKKAEPTCDNKASGTEFGVFDAGSRLFTVRL